jgi:hypothetical protein
MWPPSTAEKFSRHGSHHQALKALAVNGNAQSHQKVNDRQDGMKICPLLLPQLLPFAADGAEASH